MAARPERLNLERAAVAPVVSGREDCVPRSLYLAPDGAVRTDAHPRDYAAILASGQGTLWVDVDSTNTHQHALLEKVFHFHPLAVEDTLNPMSRVKYDEYDGYLFVIVRGVRFCEETPDNPYDLDTVNVCFFLGRNYVVTVHADHSAAIAQTLQRATRADVLSRGPARLMHAVVDAIVDEFFPILDRIDEFVDGLEERVFVDFDRSALRDIFSVKRLVLSLRRHLGPQRDVLNQLTNRPSDYLAPSAQLYFRDVYDHVLRITDGLDTYRELLSSTLDSYLSQVSNRLAVASKTLGVVATVTLPFVIMSGMWGMNFDGIPLAHQPHGFALLLVLQLVIAAALVAILRWRRVL